MHMVAKLNTGFATSGAYLILNRMSVMLETMLK